jgi:hypothetical protein
VAKIVPSQIMIIVLVYSIFCGGIIIIIIIIIIIYSFTQSSQSYSDCRL